MNKKPIIFSLFVILMLSGCGKQYKVKKIVEDFMDTNISQKYSDFSVIKFDSTDYVADSMISVMRNNVDTSSIYKRDVKFTKRNNTRLLFLTSSFKAIDRNGKYVKQCQTFYINKDMSGVVSFKNN
jgi:uncharacterized lipoprotein YehR (DUF1307 family)